MAALLSAALPGAGQCYLGNRPTGVALLCTSFGVCGGILLSLWGPAALRSRLTMIVLAAIYPFVWLPAVIDAWQAARGKTKPLLAGHHRWYVILMLLTVGPMSLPMLWQNKRFSQRTKFAWTGFIIAVFAGGVLLAVVFLPWLERVMRLLGISLT
jgi:hypothetical protein